MWIWYSDDFEIYHGMKQNFDRERPGGMLWPAFWKMDSWNNNVVFKKTYNLNEATTFTAYAEGDGYVNAAGRLCPLGEEIKIGPGEVNISVNIGSMETLPALFIEGEVIHTDESWTATNFREEKPVGFSKLYRSKDVLPEEVPYMETKYLPGLTTIVNGGHLFDFGCLLNGVLEVICDRPVDIYFGESEEEATDIAGCYLYQKNVTKDTKIKRRGFRYIYIPETEGIRVSVSARHMFIPISVKGRFRSDDELLNKIWSVAEETYKMCSGLFFIDGVKRDRWIWSGDAYQSYFVNPYLYFDEEINKRTIRALRGNEHIEQHLNTIVDYSMLWIMSIENEYEMTGDIRFVDSMYDKAKALMNLLFSQRDENGFIIKRPGDWIFIDWAPMDKDGALSGEQMLFLNCLNVMTRLSKLLKKDGRLYSREAKKLKKNIDKFFWDSDAGAYIDCFSSGKRNVTKHANIFALLYDIADEDKKKIILDKVIFSDDVTPITTPYFKFFELDMLAKYGYLDRVMEEIKSYWGGMLSLGATTFWEEYDPEKKGKEHYEMYGGPYEKSLCHAWGASPIYLIGRYFLGVYPTSAGYETFNVSPKLSYFEKLKCEIPVKDGLLYIDYDGKTLEVECDREGGTLILDGKKTEIPVI